MMMVEVLLQGISPPMNKKYYITKDLNKDLQYLQADTLEELKNLIKQFPQHPKEYRIQEKQIIHKLLKSIEIKV